MTFIREQTFFQTYLPTILIALLIALTGTGFLFFADPFSTHAATCGFGSSIGGGQCRGYLTTADTSPWTVPTDWNASNNTIDLIGAGGGGSGGTTASGGGVRGHGGGGG